MTDRRHEARCRQCGFVFGRFVGKPEPHFLSFGIFVTVVIHAGLARAEFTCPRCGAVKVFTDIAFHAVIVPPVTEPA